MEEKKSSPVGVGVLTVLTVLLVLALAVFSVLTFTTAKADLALSERNAETVQAYYLADRQAKEEKAAFLAGTEEEYESTIPITETQNLYIRLTRNPDGSCKVLWWKTVPQNEDGGGIDLGGDSLPIWDGGALPG